MDAAPNPNPERDFDSLFTNPFIMKTLARNGVFAIDYRALRALANELWLSWGYSAEDMLAGTLLDIVHPEDKETIASHYRKLTDGEEEHYEGEYRIRARDGRTVWISVRYEVLAREPEGKPWIIVGHDEDISSLREANDQVRTQLLEIETLKDLVEGMHQSLDLRKTTDLVMEHLRGAVHFDRAFVQLVEGGRLGVFASYGFAEGSLPEMRFPVEGPDNPPVRALETKRAVVCNDLGKDFPGFIQADPETTIRSWLGIPLVANGNSVGLLAMDSSRPGFFTERHVALAGTAARQIATAVGHAQFFHRVPVKTETDKLTGIANRYGLEERGQELFRSAMQDRKPLGLLLVDIDRFKVTNDRHGHDHGDRILRSVSAIIAENLRGEDFPLRYGGDEFVVMLAGANVQEAFSIAERIRLRIAYAAPDERGVAPTVSIGVHSGIPKEREFLHEFVAFADRALYEAKKMGRNRCCISAESLQAGN
jgi:diguanylate cyclase (GGDEF)-like protein/PAS domain S-box-containing protein